MRCHSISHTLRLFFLLPIALLTVHNVSAASLTETYNAQRPVVVVGDWDKPPYEFLNDKGQPDGSNVELMRALCERLGIPCRFILKEWSGALKTFERGEADIIFANVRRYKRKPYVCSENTINYNRISAATCKADSTGVISNTRLLSEGLVLKPGDYTSLYFRDLDSLLALKVEFQSPKVALQGLLAGDFSYFCWGEEPLKWKIKELHLEGITLCDVAIPISEVHFVGRDGKLIQQLDDQYLRMKQNGEVQTINDRWLHPDRLKPSGSPTLIYTLLIIFLLIVVFIGLYHVAKAHVKSATQGSRDLNNMMLKAMHMGKFSVMEYDIKRDLMTNAYGTPILPEAGISLKEFTEHIHPQEREEFARKMSGLLNGRVRKFGLKKRWMPFAAPAASSADGDAPAHYLNLDGHAIVEFDKDGQPAYVINAVCDITQSVEQDLAGHNQERMYACLANMPFVTMSFYDKDGGVININDTMREVCSIAHDDPATADFWYNVPLFDYPVFRSAYSHGDSHELLACMHMDYPKMGIDNYVEYHILPLFDEEGDVAFYFCSTINATEQHDFQRTIRILERDISNIGQHIERFDNWLNFLTKQGNTYLWYSDVSLQTAYFYRSLQTQASEDFITLPFDVYCAHMPAEERAEAMGYYNSQEPFDSLQHFNNTVLDSGESWFHITGTPVFDAEGRFTGHRGLSIDISDAVSARKRLEADSEVARNIVRLKSGFMASMTHELRTPLNAIIGFSGVLTSTDSPDERKEYIRIIQDNCDMLQRLIDDILTASSLNEGPTSIQPADVDFAKAFDDICLTLQQRIPGPDVCFIKEAPYHAFHTVLDIARVNQMITNFVTNAVKFTQQGYIKLGYTYQDNVLRVYCEDTGTGIPKDKQQAIFQRFVKLDEFVQGTGMGLSIAKSIAERMGGQIGVESNGKGHGSTFWFAIPCERRLSA